MIVCKVCGNRNNDQEEFCTSCGRYLAWSGEHVDVAPEAEPELVVQDALPETRRHGMLHRIALRLHLVREAPPTPPAVPAEAAAGMAGASPVARPAAALPAGSGAAKPAALAAAPTAGQPTSTEETELVVPELVGAQRGSVTATTAETTVPVTVVGNGEAPRALRPRRPGESLPVLPPLPGHEPPASERATVLRRPTEVADKPRPRRTRARPLAGVPELASTPSPGDIFCSRCGQFNAPSRVYCRRCGLELAAHAGTGEELGYEPLTWWQRHLHHDVRVVGAGQRPGKWGKIVSGAGSQGRALRIVSRIGMAVIAASLLLTFVGPYAPTLQNWYDNTYHSAYNWLNAREVGVNAVSATATSSAAGHPAFSAVDGLSNTWWQSATFPLPKPAVHAKPSASAKQHVVAPAGVGSAATPGATVAPRAAAAAAKAKAKATGGKGVAPATRHPLPPARPVPPGVGQVLTIQFSPSTSLNRIAWLSGAAGSLANFDSIGRPRQVLVSIPGHRPVVENLRDVQSLQTFKLAAKNVSSLQVTILAVYPGATVRAVAIDEIEPFTRS